MEESLTAVSDGSVRVVAGTDHAENATALIRRHQPDVMLLDLELAAPGPLAVLSAVRRVQPRLPVLALARSYSKLTVEAIMAGASGVLLRSTSPAGLVPSLLAATSAVSQQSGTDTPNLTATERQLWMLIGGGASTAQIAQALHVSDRTVKRLTARLLRTLGVANRTEAAALAGRTGLLDGIVPLPGAIPSPRSAPRQPLVGPRPDQLHA